MIKVGCSNIGIALLTP
ncbi:hypothetical protein NB617_08100 [Vibrio antiquarius]|nr:hypothetical protein [Vibrio antiquarius]